VLEYAFRNTYLNIQNDLLYIDNSSKKHTKLIWPDVAAAAAAAVAFAAADYAMGKVQQQLVWREMRICYTNKSLADYKLLQMRQSNGVAVMSCLHCSFRPLPAAFCHPIPTSQH